MTSSYIIYSLIICTIISIALYNKINKIEPLTLGQNEKIYKNHKWLAIWKYSLIAYALIGCLIQQVLLTIISLTYFVLINERKAYILTCFIVSLGTWIIECSLLGIIFYIKTTFNTELNIVDFLICNIVTILVWLIPNYIYFGKRRRSLSNKFSENMKNSNNNCV